MVPERPKEIVDRGIFKADNGMWWYWSPIREGRVSSLRTRDERKARRKYAAMLAQLREAFERAHAAGWP